jgi:hypothetical protein
MTEEQQQILKRIDGLLAHADELLEKRASGSMGDYVPEGDFAGWRARVANFLNVEAGPESMYTQEFMSRVQVGYVSQIEQGVGILRAIRADVDDGDFESKRPSFTLA